MKLCIEKMLVVSTAHLSGPYEIELSDHLKYCLEGYSDGWLVYCAISPESGLLNEGAEAILEMARNKGCVWVKFDPDGPVAEGIKTYDW